LTLAFGHFDRPYLGANFQWSHGNSPLVWVFGRGWHNRWAEFMPIIGRGSEPLTKESPFEILTGTFSKSSLKFWFQPQKSLFSWSQFMFCVVCVFMLVFSHLSLKQ